MERYVGIDRRRKYICFVKGIMSQDEGRDPRVVLDNGRDDVGTLESRL